MPLFFNTLILFFNQIWSQCLAKWSRVMTTVPNSSMARTWSGCHSPDLAQVPDLAKNPRRVKKRPILFNTLIFLSISRPWSQCWPSDPKAWQRCQIRPLVGPDQAATPQSFHRYLILPRISKRVKKSQFFSTLWSLFLSLQTLIPMLAKWSRVMTTVPIRPWVGPDQAATLQSFHRYQSWTRISKRV